MDWTTLINQRHTTFAWTEQVPDISIIEEVFVEAYNHIPSKNLMFPYAVYAYRNDDPKIRKEIMTICHRNRDMAIDRDRGNPQVLAPWLIGFSNRWVKDLERRYEKSSERTDPDQRDTEQLEIGMISLFFSYAFASRGLQTGFCQNIINDRNRAAEIFNIDEGQEFRFIMGVGYGKDTSTRHTYVDPRTDKERRIPFFPDNVETYYPRPDFEKVFKFRQ